MHTRSALPPSAPVLFVGAGPGAPDLLTLRGAEALRAADVVVHDRLVSTAILELIPAEAERICVDRGNLADPDPGRSTGELLVLLAAAGRRVVRLKGGDPTVFARLAEELEPLEQAGLAVELVPGVTAALAAAAALGTPLTSRGKASSLTVVTGHEARGKQEPIDFQALAAVPGTLAVYMGVEQLGAWSRQLIAAGRPGSTPVAVVSRCSWPDQRLARSTLAACAEAAELEGWQSPAIMIVGRVLGRGREDREIEPEASGFPGGETCQPSSETAALAPGNPRHFLESTESPPGRDDVSPRQADQIGLLQGRTVIVTRPHGQDHDLMTLLEAEGATCVPSPLIRIMEPTSWEPLDSAVERLDSYDWIVFASGNGVRGFFQRLRQAGRDGRALGTARLAAIGPATRQALEAAGFVCDLMPEEFRSEGLVEAFARQPPRGRFLLVRADSGRDLLRQSLESAGHHVDEVAAYRSEPVVEVQEAAGLAVAGTWLTVTSGRIVEAAVRIFGERLRHWRIASLSPVTSAVLRRFGLEPAAEAAEATAASLAAAILERERSGAPRPLPPTES
jgi:uroporphyrinogen III methyltransferase/synthase